MNNVTGPPVTGENFFGREKELEHAWRIIKAGNNINLPAPRRVGKTSFALKLLVTAQKEGWNIVHINLESITTEQAFIEIFIGQLTELSWWEKLKDKGGAFLDMLKQLKTAISYGDAKLEVEFQAKKNDIYKQLAELLDHDEPTLIFFDEVTVLLTVIIKSSPDGKQKVTNFLHWLRDIRIVAGSKIRWIFCSSVGIENFTHRNKISATLNDIENNHLKAYTKDESVQMLRNLAASSELTLNDTLLEAIVDKVAYCLPYFIQIIFKQIYYLVKVESTPVDLTIVDKAYEQLIHEKHFNTWIERIDEQYEEDAKAAKATLNHICQVKQGVTRNQLTDVLVNSGIRAEDSNEIVSRLLYMLRNDGYLIEEESRYYFRSPLLRDFWLNRFVK